MKILAIAKRVIRQTIYDKRTLALMMLAPLLILALINALFDTTASTKPTIGVYQTSSAFNKELAKQDVKIIKYSESNSINDKVINDKITEDNLDAFINYKQNNYDITYQNFDINNTNKVKITINSTLQQLSLKELQTKLTTLSKQLPITKNTSTDNKIEITNNYVYLDEAATFFDTISPIMISFVIFFFVFLVAGISFINEKTTGTLERLLVTPLKRYELVFGYFVGYGIFVVIQTIIIVIFAINILDITLAGSLFDVIILNICSAFSALSLGLLLSSFAKTEFQMVQFIPIVIIPQIFFSGIIDVSTMADWLQKLAHIFPLYYAGNSLQDIMIKGATLNQVMIPLLILILFIFIFTVINILILKKYRKT